MGHLGFSYIGLKVVWLLISTVVLGIGHIGIHLQHRREMDGNGNGE